MAAALEVIRRARRANQPLGPPMAYRTNSRLVDIASAAIFLVSVAQSVAVLERLAAASWQWYKFAGDSGGGHIVLSLKAGLVFTGISVAIFGTAFLLNRATRPTSRERTSKWSRWAMWVSGSMILVYWLLGFSDLNVWRA